MNDGVYLTIENQEALFRFVKGCVRNGYLRRFDLRKVADWIKNAEYPIKIPIKLDSVIGIGGNAVVKGIFGGNIERTISKYISEAMGEPQ